MAAKNESNSWLNVTEHLFQEDNKRLFRDDKCEKQFYDGFETYYIMDNKYPQENAKDKLLWKKKIEISDSIFLALSHWPQAFCKALYF